MSSNYPVISELLFVKKVCLFHCVCVCVCNTKCPSEFKQEVVNCINKNSLCNALLFNKMGGGGGGGGGKKNCTDPIVQYCTV